MKDHMTRLLHSIIFIVLFNNIQGQPYYFRHYQVENGLSNNTVYFITQDSKGFMWFATKDGLNRFDGFHFKVFRIKNAEDKKHLTTNYIFCILSGKDGMLWVGAQKGLYKFNPQKERLEPFIDSLANVHDITLDPAGQMWFISSNTICRFNFKTNTIKQFYPPEYFNATSICLSKNGEIWASTNNGFLEKFDSATGTFKSFDMFSHSKIPISRWIQKIHAGNNNSIFIGTNSQGLKFFDVTSYQYQDILTYNPDKTTIYVRDILQNSGNEYWIATESGIFIYNTDTKRFTNIKKEIPDPYSLSDNAIYTLYKDVEGSIWAGTYFGGINYYAKQNAAFKKYFPDNTQNAISGNAVREICKDKYGNLWIGTEDGGLNEINNTTNNLTRFKPTGEKNSISFTNIHGLLADGNNLWIGTFDHGIDIMDVRTGKIKNHFMVGPGEKDLKSNFALCFLRSKAGEILVGTANGLYYYDREKNEFKRPAEIPGNLLITSIIEDHNKIIWAGTNNQGAYWFDPVTHSSGHAQNELYNKNSLSNNAVNDLYEDSNSSIWFSTEGGGLCRLSSDRKNFTLYTTNDGLPANFIFKVLEDNKKNLWVSTSRGLVNFEPNFKNITVYTQANGLLNNQFNYHSGYKDEDGRLYFGSVKGMISFKPDDILKSTFIPPVYIMGLEVYNVELNPEKDSSILKKTITFTDKIVLPYYQSSISIDFAALSYISPEMTAYKYKLEGLDNDWTTINTNRKVYFTNLSPNKYVFKIKASANDLWSDKNEKQLIIEINPPIWATRWAYLIYAILIILVLYYFITNYNKRQHQKKEKEIYESKIDFFTNVAHEIRTPLTLIKGPVENLLEKKHEMPEIKEDLACLDRNTNRLINLVSQILDFRQTEIKSFTLDFTKVNVNEILRETSLSFNIMAKKKKLDYELILPPYEVQYADKKVFIKLYDLRKDTGDFKVVFENDGYIIEPEFGEKIFEPFYRIKETKHQKGTGIGLTLAKSLVDLHKGSLYLKSIKKGFNTFVLSIPVEPEPTYKQKPLQKQPLS